MKQFKNFYEGTYAKYILPGVLLQSVLIGGGYATGREIYSYGAKFGAMGWISGLTIGIGFALFAFLTFEICRIYKVYDYKNYIKQVIGPLWPMMDILTVLIAILLIAVMAAATGSIFEQVGLPNILGSVVIVLICGLLNFKGSKMIEKFESIRYYFTVWRLYSVYNSGTRQQGRQHFPCIQHDGHQHLRRLCHCSAVHLTPVSCMLPTTSIPSRWACSP